MRSLKITPALEFKVPYSIDTKAGRCTVDIERVPSRPKSMFDITVNNLYGKTLGSEILESSARDRTLYGITMEAAPEYRQKGYRIGEILRLNSVAVMLKEGLEKLDIYAKNTAAVFHKKYKFNTSEMEPERAKIILTDIANDKHPDFKKLSVRAKFALLNPDLDNPSAIVDSYLNKIIEGQYNPDEHRLSTSLPMLLTEKDVDKNAEFFNSLYEKHNINFRI